VTEAARLLTRFAALRRAARRRRAREGSAPADDWGRSEELLITPAIIEAARSRLPGRVGPFHKGTLTLAALAAIAESEPAIARMLVHRFQRLLALEAELSL
jgi:hypothetical protein